MDASLNKFEITDWRNRIVRLTNKTFEAHCFYRPETVQYLNAAKEVIRDPDIVLLNDKNATLLYRFGLGNPPFTNLYLQVVIYYGLSKGFEKGTVATFFFTDETDDDAVIIEHRAQFVAGQRFMLAGKGRENDHK